MNMQERMVGQNKEFEACAVWLVLSPLRKEAQAFYTAEEARSCKGS
jgi:hypothetical protein